MKTNFMKMTSARSVESQPSVMPQLFHPRLAFTLIELLVVISIMALIAAMLFPVGAAVKKQQYLKTARAEMEQIAIALDNYKAKYGVYPPGNAKPTGTYAAPVTNSLLPQLYYELSGVTNNGTDYVTLDSSSKIHVGDVSPAYGLGGFINCSKPGDEDSIKAKNFLPSLKPNRINQFVTNNNIQTTMLVTSVGGPDQNYKPLQASDLNPFRYVYPGINNPTSYDLWVQLQISGKKYLVCNWNNQVQINSPLP